MVSNEIPTSVCVSPTRASKPPDVGVFSQFSNSDSCIRAALEMGGCSFATQSDVGLTLQ